jgi:aryl sulfotransferase
MNHAINNQANIYWLASYPKSGNTWTRAFIANLLHEDPEPVDINELFTGAIASSREWVESALNFDIDELSHDEIDLLRPNAYRWLSQNLESPGYHKIHDAYIYLPNGEALIPAEATKGALCIIRNPLDLVISLANHNSCTIDKAIEHINNPGFSFCNKSGHINSQLRQKLLTWSEHIISWTTSPIFNIQIIRYEDMKHKPLDTFTKMANFLNLSSNKESIIQALAHCSIEKLQAQEKEKSFREKSAKSILFFRKGIVGDWQNILSEAQTNTIIKEHKVVMQRFGYLDEQGQPTTLIRKQIGK